MLGQAQWRLLPLAATIALLSGASLLGAHSASGAYHYWHFQTPSRNIKCAGQAILVQCWVVSTGGGGRFPKAWALRPRGRVDSFRPGDGPGNGPILRYGQLWSAGALRCRSRLAGLRCWSTISGHGYFLSRGVQRIF